MSMNRGAGRNSWLSHPAHRHSHAILVAWPHHSRVPGVIFGSANRPPTLPCAIDYPAVPLPGAGSFCDTATRLLNLNAKNVHLHSKRIVSIMFFINRGFMIRKTCDPFSKPALASCFFLECFESAFDVLLIIY